MTPASPISGCLTAERYHARVNEQVERREGTLCEERAVPGFNVEHFRRVLHTRSIGRLCHYQPVIASTNATARLLGRQGQAEGAIVLADAQTSGRGQAGKVWISPPERNVYVSILLRPAIAPTQAALISLLAAVALADALRQEGAACGIKWPNDVLLQHRKVAGILTEMEIYRDAVQFVIVGIGINVNMTQTELDRDLGPIAPSATSMAVALGREICREGLLAALMESLEQWYDRFRTEGIPALHDAWEARSLMRSRRVSAHTPEASWKGMAEGIDQAGRLLLRRDEGGLVTLTSAEVRFLD
jgi:BirA family biotin operon repressor/biotin-[acetyl-CoA-carboxylase] ligase